MGWEPLPGDEDPVTLTDSLSSLQRRLGGARPDALATLQAQWVEIVGTRLAAHCELRSVHDATMVVATAEPAVAEQLRWAGSDLVAAVNAVVGDTLVRSVDVVVRR